PRRESGPDQPASAGNGSVTRFDGLQSKVPALVGYSRTNLAPSNFRIMKHGELTWLPGSIVAHIPPALNECVFFNAVRRLARVSPLTPWSLITCSAACWNSSVDTQPQTAKELLSFPTYLAKAASVLLAFVSLVSVNGRKFIVRCVLAMTWPASESLWS